jgi:hypothetical protein
MRIENLKQCMMAGIITLTGACGNSTATESATDGGSGSGSSGASNETTEATSATTSGVSDSDSVTAGSNSESQTMGTTPTSTEPTTDPTDTATTGKVTATEGDTDTSTTAEPETGTTGGTSGDSSSGTTGVMLGPCGDGKQWTLDADFDAGVLSNVNHDAPNSDQLQITVDGISAPKPYMFVAQTYEGWVLKLDTETGKQLARYETVRLADCPTCDPSRQTWYPSRIIVDFEGDMYIANRAFSYQGSISKIAGSESGCLDRNKNGVIDTSYDANKDGIVERRRPRRVQGPKRRVRPLLDGRRRLRHLPPRPHPRRQGQRLRRHLPGPEGLQARHHPDPAASWSTPTTCRARPTASSSAATTCTPRPSARR